VRDHEIICGDDGVAAEEDVVSIGRGDQPRGAAADRVLDPLTAQQLVAAGPS
jgi:hypothetical protein